MNILPILNFHGVSKTFTARKNNTQMPKQDTVTYFSDLKADLYRISSKKQIPAVILIHGGFWSKGDRTELSDFATKLAKNDFLAMTVDYHLLPKYSQQAQTNDITNAIWWLRENSKKFGINPNKIGIIGLSAGGYHAAWVATHDKINSNGTRSIPNAAISVCGPWDLTNVPENSVKLVEEFCAGVAQSNSSPLYAMSKSMPPVLLIHGDADEIVPVSQSISAYKKLKLLHCKCHLAVIPNGGHIFPQDGNYLKAMKISINFLKRVFSKAISCGKSQVI